MLGGKSCIMSPGASTVSTESIVPLSLAYSAVTVTECVYLQAFFWWGFLDFSDVFDFDYFVFYKMFIKVLLFFLLASVVPSACHQCSRGSASR